MFARAAAHYTRQRHTLCLELAGTLHGEGILSRFSSSVLQIENTRMFHRAASKITLLELLWKFRPLEAGDKRDKVYALLGLTTDWQGQKPMRPDYEKHETIVFLQMSLKAIQSFKSLSVLCGDMEAALGRKRMNGLASWVMDWSLPCPTLESERFDTLQMYNASGGRKSSIKLHQLHFLLDVSGIYFDNVVEVGDVSRHTQIAETVAVTRKWNLLVKDYEEVFPFYPGGGSYDDAFWRTLVGDLVHTGPTEENGKETGTNYRRAGPADRNAFDAWRMWSRCISRDTLNRAATFTQRDLDEGISSIHYALKTATSSRRFFLTRKGYMGIGPKTTSPGDRVCFFKDSNVPFLLRPDSLRDCSGFDCVGLVPNKKSKCKEVHSCHRLIGDCFVYGLMDGEAFEQPSIPVQRFYLV
jgi:hypothetical protein